MELRPQIRAALRAALDAVVQATTNAQTTLAYSAASGGYTRSAGSFVTDNFIRGGEIQVSGFAASGGANNGRSIITDVAAGLLKTERASDDTANVDEAAGPAVTIISKIPQASALENHRVEDRKTKYPWWRETLRPLEAPSVTIGQNPRTVTQLLYLVDLFYPENAGLQAAEYLASAICTAMRPGTVLAVGLSRIEVVEATSFGAIPEDGWSLLPVQIRARVPNPA